MTDYDPVQIANDATAFAESRFGAHYLKRLHELRANAIKVAMNAELTDSFRAHAGTQAAVYDTELNYFKTSQTIADSPKLMRKLKEGFEKRLSRTKEVGE